MSEPVHETADSPRNGLNISRRHFVVGAVLASAAIGTQAAQPRVTNRPVNQKEFASWIPGNFGAWTYEVASGVVLPPPDILASRLYDNLVTKTYSRPGWPSVTMLIAYNYRQDGVLQIHRPEICYPAGGYALSPTETTMLQVTQGHMVPANFFTAQSTQRTEQVLYWTRIASSFPNTWFGQRLAVMGSNLRGSIPDGVLIRFSVVDGDREQSLDTLRKFVAEFYHAAGAPLHRLLLGDV